MMLFDVQALHPLLSLGLNTLGIDVDETTRDKLLTFLAILSKWNTLYNLTAITQPEEMVQRHLLDSLSIFPYLHGKQIIDVGTGAGLPGLPLAICFPEKNFTLLDSDGKRTRFLQHIQASLGITNIAVVKSRVENFHPAILFDTILTRAFSSLAEMLEKTAHLGNKEGQFLAMKGCYPSEELQVLPGNYKVNDVVRLSIPGVEAERHLVIVVKVESPQNLHNKCRVD